MPEIPIVEPAVLRKRPGEGNKSHFDNFGYTEHLPVYLRSGCTTKPVIVSPMIPKIAPAAMNAALCRILSDIHAKIILFIPYCSV